LIENYETRSSIMRVVRGSQSLRLDMADKLTAYFGLALTAAKKRS
jgi:plasmid maintenance system antidote protein VapI